jgi:NADH dehydrogenase/NADH:ubiquinone oxidoreductase subunit G
VLPGASSAEKEASYTNEQGRLQGTARAVPLAGNAREDWQIITNLAAALGAAFDYPNAASVRAAIADRFKGAAGIEGLTALVFGQRVSRRHWLQDSNPSERWKWDVLFQDLPPVKGTVDPTALPPPPGVITLREVK